MLLAAAGTGAYVAARPRLAAPIVLASEGLAIAPPAAWRVIRAAGSDAGVLRGLSVTSGDAQLSPETANLKLVFAEAVAPIDQGFTPTITLGVRPLPPESRPATARQSQEFARRALVATESALSQTPTVRAIRYDKLPGATMTWTYRQGAESAARELCSVVTLLVSPATSRCYIITLTTRIEDAHRYRRTLEAVARSLKET